MELVSEFMADRSPRSFELDAVRTDGWFERIGEGIGSFQALCEIIGERFFAFSIIVGARITALTVDRRNPDLSLVDFVVGARDNDETLEPQQLTLADFRRRLVGALLVEDDKPAPEPTRDTEVEAIQLFIGVRYLLLAPLYGYSLRKLLVGGRGPQGDAPEVVVLHDGVEETHDLDAFRFRMRAIVREELVVGQAPARRRRLVEVGGGLLVGEVDGQLENLRGKGADVLEQARAAGEEEACAE